MDKEEVGVQSGPNLSGWIVNARLKRINRQIPKLLSTDDFPEKPAQAGQSDGIIAAEVVKEDLELAGTKVGDELGPVPVGLSGQLHRAVYTLPHLAFNQR